MRLQYFKIPLFLLLISFSFNLKAYIFIDVDEFFFKQSSQKGIRVGVIDTIEQKFIYIDYYPYKISTKNSKPKKNLNLPYYYYDLEINYHGDITVSASFKIENYIIRTKGKIFCSVNKKKSLGKFVYQEGNYDILSYKIPIKTGKFIKERFNNFKNRSPSIEGEFKIFFYKNGKEKERYFYSLVSNEQDKKEERGLLGELATSLTMMSYGYDRFFSQNASNQGIDGVFRDKSDKPELFLSESRCRNVDANCQTMLKNLLHESKIHERIEKTENSDTRDMISKFVNKYPNRIFLFAHRIMPNGLFQAYVRRFDKFGYISSILPHLDATSPPKAKLEAAKTIGNRLYKSPLKHISALIKDLSPNDLKRLNKSLKNLSFDDDDEEEEDF